MRQSGIRNTTLFGERYLRLNRIHNGGPVWLFLAIVLVGIVAVTVSYRSLQLVPPPQHLHEQMSDMDKQLVSAQGDMSKWLLGLASGSLAGLIGVRLKTGANDLFTQVPMAAYAFLVLSLYGAFLHYHAMVNVLRVGPLDYLYGDQLRLPILVQFWSLLAAVVLLGIWLLRTKTHLPVLLICFCALALSSSAECQANQPAASQSKQAFDLPSCVKDWYSDRLKASGANPNLAASVLHRIEKQPHAKIIANCIDADSVLDQLRFAAVQSGKPDNHDSFSAYLNSVLEELQHPDLSTSDVVRAILNLMSPWENDLGVLSVRASHGTYQVLLQGDPFGITNCTRRLKPGVYSIRVVSNNFKIAFSSDSVKISASETTLIDLDQLRP